MSELIGPFAINGTEAEITSIRAMATKLAGKLLLPDKTYRIRPTTVDFLPPAEMPEYAPGKAARGFYKSGPPKILMNNEIGKYRVAQTFAHEAMHALDEDWLEKSHRTELKETMTPEPAGWDGEIFATYASAAIGDFTNPPYTDIYDNRVIPAKLWDLVEKISLRDDRSPPPPPAADCSECEARVEELGKQLTAQSEAIVALKAELDTANSALSVAKIKAQQIEVKAGEIDDLAKEIEAL